MQHDRRHRRRLLPVQQGDQGVLVGVIDTGIDGSHPDIAPNFNGSSAATSPPTSRDIDGACVRAVDHVLRGPGDVDDDGHGTHVAGTIAAPINGFGMAGVAPNVTLVNVRAGQDSGFFFLQPSGQRAHLRRRHRHRRREHELLHRPVAVQLPGQPGSTRSGVTAGAEQRTDHQGVDQRRLDYAHKHGVTLVSAAGNCAHQPLHQRPGSLDDVQPGLTRPRPVRPPYRTDHPAELIAEPSEGKNVIAVTAIGPSAPASRTTPNYGNRKYRRTCPTPGRRQLRHRADGEVPP